MLLFRNISFAILFALCALTAGAAGPIDINTASADEIAAAIKGIGPKKAAAIVAYRQQHGPFQSVDELQKVPGIGDKLIQANKDNLTVGDKKPMAVPASPTVDKPAVPAAPAVQTGIKPSGQTPLDKAPAVPKQ